MHSERGEEVLRFWGRIALIAVLAIVVAVACSSAPASAAPATVGEALFDKGYRFALFVAAQDDTPGSFHCQWGRCMLGAFSPWQPYTASPESHVARWGVSSSGAVIAGNTVGERLPDSSELACVLEKLGLPAGYRVTETDRSDLKVAAPFGGAATAWDLELSAARCGPDPTPTCELPKVCMVPPAPCLNCPVCPICPPQQECPTLPPLSAAEQRAEEIGVLLRPIHHVFAKHSYWRKRLPPWSELWAASKPLVVEILLAKRRFELRASAGGDR